MQKPASALVKGDQLLTHQDYVTVLNVGEDRIAQEQVIYWNDWNNKPIRIALTQTIQTK